MPPTRPPYPAELKHQIIELARAVAVQIVRKVAFVFNSILPSGRVRQVRDPHRGDIVRDNRQCALA